jgi:hypothetical protein
MESNTLYVPDPPFLPGCSKKADERAKKIRFQAIIKKPEMARALLTRVCQRQTDSRGG